MFIKLHCFLVNFINIEGYWRIFIDLGAKLLLEVSSNLVQYSSELCAVIIFSRAGHFSCTINLLVYVSTFVYYSITIELREGCSPCGDSVFRSRDFSVPGIDSGFFKGIRSGSNDKRFVMLNRCGLPVLSSSLPSCWPVTWSLLLLMVNRVAESSRLGAVVCFRLATAVNQYPHCACHLSFSLPCPASITLYSSLSFSLCFSLALHELSVALRSSRPFSLAVTFTLCFSLFLSFSYFPFTFSFSFSSSHFFTFSPFPLAHFPISSPFLSIALFRSFLLFSLFSLFSISSSLSSYLSFQSRNLSLRSLPCGVIGSFLYLFLKLRQFICLYISYCVFFILSKARGIKGKRETTEQRKWCVWHEGWKAF